MNDNLIFLLILIFVLTGFFLDRYLSWINSRSWKADIPDEMKDFYDESGYLKARDYDRARNGFDMWNSVFNLALILAMLLFDGFAALDHWSRKVTENDYLLPLLYFAILFFASGILNLHFSAYYTFVIEEKFGFNKTSPILFLADKVKEIFIGLILGTLVLTSFIWFYHSLGEWFWLAAWAMFAFLAVFLSMFYTSIIVPFFNKLEPLKEGALRKSIEKYCENVNFKLANIFVMDGSKRSTKSNAYFSGLGQRKKIVLFDTLIEKQNEQEITAVLAHEVGHYKLKHNRITLLISILQTGFMLFLLSLFIGNEIMGRALGVEQMSIHIGLVCFALLYSPVSTIFGIGMNILSRKNEFQADAYASRTYKGEYLISALKKLSVDNLSNLYPHPVYVFVHYSHPPLLTRLSAIKKVTSA